MIWALIVFQIISIQINWWVFFNHNIQPKHNHPPVFWNPVTKQLLLTMPWVTTIALVLLGFAFTDYGWIFLLVTFLWWIIRGYIYFKSFSPQVESESIELSEQVDNEPIEKITPKKEWLLDLISHEDIFSGAIYEDASNASFLPAGTSENVTWLEFQKNIKPNDEVWTFSSTKEKIRSPIQWTGICLIRGGEVIDCLADEMHLSFRKSDV